MATSLLTNDIVHFSRPYLPGDRNDIAIFRQELKYKLDDNERVVADSGYIGESPGKIICQKSLEVLGPLDKTAWCRKVGKNEAFLSYASRAR